MTKIDKGKVLRETRERLGWKQPQMADALGLEKSYLSQLENGHREVDEYYLMRAAEIEKANSVKVQEDAIPYRTGSVPLRLLSDEALEYLLQDLGKRASRAPEVTAAMHEITLEQSQSYRTPGDRTPEFIEHQKKTKVSYKPPVEAESIVAANALAAGTGESEGSSPPSGAGAPGAHKPEPPRPSSRESKLPPAAHGAKEKK